MKIQAPLIGELDSADARTVGHMLVWEGKHYTVTYDPCDCSLLIETTLPQLEPALLPIIANTK